MVRCTYSKTNAIINRERRQCGGGGLMVWGMVFPNGLVTLKIVESRFNSQKYISMLTNFAVPIMKLNFKEFNFVQDNAKIHTSN